MVRFNITQSVWKNSEDEILKAAVMKYGLNQWGRVASLFAKRSARQCKARWDEWLDPNIKKTEWSREEDEKLLHLAKLMPTQWRTIAPLVGRTAAQCLERYERLLDAAAAGEEAHEEPEKEKDEFDEGGEEEEGGDGAISSKKKKRIAAAETLPAKPDAQDMDEEELEMLSEAKARLANTLGKKAKRKARERQLEEQQRIAQLQKRRELKAAGVATGKFTVVDHRKRRRKNSDAEHIDYTTEVPFEQVAPKGPYDVSQEKLDSARRERDEKARIANLAVAHEAKKALEKKQAKKKSATMNVKDLEARLAAERRRNEEALAMARKARAPLSLPEPQVSDAELEEVAKASFTAPGPFAAPPLPSNRTKGDLILQEARNQLARDGREDIQVEGEGTGWKTALPRSSASSSTGEARKGLASLASRRTFAGANGRVVVLRDELGINKEPTVEDDTSVIGDAEEMAAGAVKGLQAALISLPAPEYEYSIQVKKPKAGDRDDDDEHDDQSNIPMDAREKERKRMKMMEEKQRRIFNLLPTASKLNLPELPVGNSLTKLVDSENDLIRKLILSEMRQGLVSGNASSVDMESLPQLEEVANAQLNLNEIQNLDQIFNGLVDYSSLENPLELFLALRKEVAKVSKENEQIRTITSQAIQSDKERAEAAVKETMSLFKKHKAALMGRDLSKWMKAKEDEAVEFRLEQIQKELASMSQAELELQRKWAERLA